MDRSGQQVYMIGHQDVGVHMDFVFRRGRGESEEVPLAIGVVAEACGPVVATLDNVQGDPREVEASAVRHGLSMHLRRKKHCQALWVRKFGI